MIRLRKASAAEGRSVWQPQHQAEYRAARNWLTCYRPRLKEDNLSKVKGYLEAFAHMCHLSEWEIAQELVMMPLKDESESASIYASTSELHRLLFVWGYYAELRELYQTLWKRASPEIDLICLSGLGNVSDVSGDYVQAVDFYQQALALATALESEVASGNAFGGLANAYLSLGQQQLAIDYYHKQLALGRRIESDRVVGTALGNLANVYRLEGNNEQALEFAHERVAIARTLSDTNGEAEGLCTLGSIYLAQKKLSKAEAILQQAARLADRFGYRRVAGRIYGSLGLVHVERREQRLAVEDFESSLKLARAVNDREGQQLAVLQLGKLTQQLGNHEQAISYQQEAVGFVADHMTAATLLLNIGTAYREMGYFTEAIECYQNLLMTVGFLRQEEAIEQRLLSMMGFYCLALVYETQGELQMAFEYCRKALELSDEIVLPLTDKCLELQKMLKTQLFESMGSEC